MKSVVRKLLISAVPPPLLARIRSRIHLVTGRYAKSELSRAIMEWFRDQATGIYIDIGANDPVVISNTFGLYRKGWSGVTVEPIPYFAEAHRSVRPRDTCLNVAVSSTPGELTFYEFKTGGLSTLDEGHAKRILAEGHPLVGTKPVKLISLQQIVDQHLPGKTIDLLTVDVEGHDLEVLQSADWSRFAPKYVVFEANDESSRRAILAFLEPLGYQVCGVFEVNTAMKRV